MQTDAMGLQDATISVFLIIMWLTDQLLMSSLIFVYVHLFVQYDFYIEVFWQVEGLLIYVKGTVTVQISGTYKLPGRWGDTVHKT